MRTVSVLFCDPKGTYASIPGVELWGPERDARTYAGPHPVIAHPPCHLWTNLAKVNHKRYGGEHNRPGNDGGCFASALAAVWKWGGVLEHPAFTNAWDANGLFPPKGMHWEAEDTWSPLSLGWTTEVWQSAYGHKARKRTWLYYRSANRCPLPANWERKPGTHQCGWFDRTKPTLSKKEASSTPLAFAEYLISLARNS